MSVSVHLALRHALAAEAGLPNKAVCLSQPISPHHIIDRACTHLDEGRSIERYDNFLDAVPKLREDHHTRVFFVAGTEVRCNDLQQPGQLGVARNHIRCRCDVIGVKVARYARTAITSKALELVEKVWVLFELRYNARLLLMLI